MTLPKGLEPNEREVKLHLGGIKEVIFGPNRRINILILYNMKSYDLTLKLVTPGSVSPLIINVTEFTTVAIIKLKIQQKYTLINQNEIDIFNFIESSGNLKKLEDYETLAYCGITPGKELYVYYINEFKIKMKTFIPGENMGEMSLVVKNKHSIEEIKKMLKEKYQLQQYKLNIINYSNSGNLVHDFDTVQSCKINKNTELFLNCIPMITTP